jgi:recombinational DNA repair protein (RecF pathway)
MYKCQKCKKELEASDTYEYRGAYSCSEHFEEVQASRNFERQEIMTEEAHKLKPLEGLSFGDSVVGRANREIMKPQLEIARKESGRIKVYEGR